MDGSLIQLIVNGLNYGFIYALLALSINIIYSSSNIINFAQGELMMLGLMFSVTFYSSGMLPFPWALLLIIAVLFAIGILQYQTMVKRLLNKQVPMITIIIATLGLGIVLKGLASFFWGKDQRYAKPPLGDETIPFLGESLLPQSFLIFVMTVFCLGVIWFVYNKTLYGLAIRATAFNPNGARLVGINIQLVILVSFGLGAALAGMAGVLFGPISYASPWHGLSFAINGFAAAIVGGLGSWSGAVLGGIVLAVFIQLATLIVGPDWGEGLTLVLMLLILYIRPSGLLGDPLAQEGAMK